MKACSSGILAIADRQHSHGSNIGPLPCSRAMPRCHEPCATARRSRRFSDSPCRCRGRSNSKPTAGSCFGCLGLHQRIVVLEAAKEELSNLAALQREELQYLNNRQGCWCQVCQKKLVTFWRFFVLCRNPFKKGWEWNKIEFPLGFPMFSIFFLCVEQFRISSQNPTSHCYLLVYGNEETNLHQAPGFWGRYQLSSSAQDFEELQLEKAQLEDDLAAYRRFPDRFLVSPLSRSKWWLCISRGQAMTLHISGDIIQRRYHCLTTQKYQQGRWWWTTTTTTTTARTTMTLLRVLLWSGYHAMFSSPVPGALLPVCGIAAKQKLSILLQGKPGFWRRKVCRSGKPKGSALV